MSASARSDSARSFWSRVVDVASLATTPVSPSKYLALVLPLAASDATTLKARVEATIDETPDARTLVLRPGRGWRGHRAGQYVRVGVAVDGRIVNRTYSISSAPGRRDGCFTITVKAIPGGRASGALVRRVAVGEHLDIDHAAGDFVMPEGAPVRPLFVTAGSGITPVMSMLREAAARGTLRDVAHVHYAPTEVDVIFGAEIAQLAAAHPGYRFVLVKNDREAPRPLTGAALDATVPDWRAREAWACGPAGLLDAIEGVFADASRAHALHVERFRPKLAPPSDAAGGRVRFGLSKKDVEAEGNIPLLDIAERAGVRAPSGCRMGICHSCDATLVAGCVRDLRTGARIDEPGARVQPCVCAAAGDVELSL